MFSPPVIQYRIDGGFIGLFPGRLNETLLSHAAIIASYLVASYRLSQKARLRTNRRLARLSPNEQL